jgi:hypothetical protein
MGHKKYLSEKIKKDHGDLGYLETFEVYAGSGILGIVNSIIPFLFYAAAWLDPEFKE